MKKTLSIVLAVIMLIGGLFVLTGCGDKKKEEEKKPDLSQYAGTYTGIRSKFVGSKEYDNEEFSLELNADGTGKSTRDGNTYDVITWSVDGENFKMTEKFLGMTIDYTGTLKGKDLHTYNDDPESELTYEYEYKKAN